MSRTCDICDRDFSCRQNLWRHMNTHKTTHGEGLFTQKLNGQLKVGYGLKSKYDKGVNGIGKYTWKGSNDSCTSVGNDEKEAMNDSESEDHVSPDESIDESTDDGMDDDVEDDSDDSLNESDNDDESNDNDKGEDIGKYVWNMNLETNRCHSPLLPKDIRALIVGKSGAGKSVFLTYLLLEPDMLDYNNLIVCGPSLHQPLYNIMKRGFSMNLSKDQVRAIFENQDAIRKHETVENLLNTYNGRCKGGINADFIENVDLIPDPSEFDEHKKNILVLDDVLLGPQNKIEDMYTRGRHNGIDTFYIAQNYFKLPRQTVRENSNFIVLFPQDMKNLNHIYNDHCAGDGINCQQFQDFCGRVWRSGKHKYVILDLSRDADQGKYRTSLRDFWIPG